MRKSRRLTLLLCEGTRRQDTWQAMRKIAFLPWEMFASLFSFGSMLSGFGQTGYLKRRKKESQRKIGLMLGK